VHWGVEFNTIRIMMTRNLHVCLYLYNNARVPDEDIVKGMVHE
jgi:hypothetical protein